LKKILAVTDSLGLPREFPEKVDFEFCWPVLLKEHFLIHQVSIGGATIDQLWRQMEYHRFFNPEYVVLQSGIVDCAPRALSRIENDLINHFSITKKMARKYLPKYNTYLRRKRDLTYTRLRTFRNFLLKFKSGFVNENNVISIGIVPGNKDYELKVPGILKNITLFDNVIKEVFPNNHIDLQEISGFGIMSDHIHLNKEGHQYIYQRILERLENHTED
jgi:hypothetical protein